RAGSGGRFSAGAFRSAPIRAASSAPAASLSLPLPRLFQKVRSALPGLHTLRYRLSPRLPGFCRPRGDGASRPFSFPKILGRDFRQPGSSPEFVQVVVPAQILQKNVDNDIPVVDDDPLPFLCPLYVQGFAELLETGTDRVGYGDHLLV